MSTQRARHPNELVIATCFANFLERRTSEVLRIHLLRGWVHKLDGGSAEAHALSFGNNEEALAVDTFLTLVIALGGIATGIGAIWAALLARRQAQSTERSLAQAERSLAEQNERSRLTLEADLLTRMRDRFESPHFLGRRRAAARFLLDNVIVDGDVVEARRLPRAVFDVCNFYDELGELHRLEAVQFGSVWNRFGAMARAYWLLCEPNLKRRHDPAMYEDFERLNRLGTELDRGRGVEPHPRAWLRSLLEDEAVVGEESATTE